MKQKLFYYFKKIRFILFAIALVIAFIGSYQYHFNEYASPIKGIQVVLYSTVKLFAFSPTSFVTGEAPLLYEIAVWLAPAVTMVGFFSLFQKIYQRIKFGIFHIGKKHILLLGDNDNTVEFIKSINREKDKTAAILLCDISDSVDEEKYKNLLTKVVRIDFSNPEDPINRMTLRDEKLGKRIRIVSFEEEPKNFGLISKLHQMKFWDHIVEVYVETKNYRIKELIEARMDQLKDFDLHYFNIQELLVKKLMEDSSFNFNPIAGFNDDWSAKTFSSMEEIAEELGTFNILIIGFSEISEHFLSQASNLLTVNPLKNLSVTVMDSSVSRFNNFINSRKMISKVIDFEFIEVGEAAYKIKPEAEKRHLDKTFSAVFFGFDDVNKNIILVDNLIESFNDVPFAVYATNTVELNTVIESLKLRHKKITPFGDKAQVLNRQVIIKEELLDKAKYFNSYYNEVMNDLMGWESDGKSEEEQWMSLSNIKKESSTYQAAHRQTKLKLLGKFTEAADQRSTPGAIIKTWKEKLAGKSVSEQLKVVESDPYMNYMTALEHKRWNNFYYMRNFVFAEEKDEYMKKHDCLIDDWTEFMGGKQRDKAIFDTLSSLSLYSEDELGQINTEEKGV